ncbi:hypothetical protein GCM10010298_69470 [Streptomyces microflavus]|uniref:Uncharacterized protein n=1 Tax=Streptomyces microflavus TaxID=1919 RepID=A0A7J0D531_STRMI|nr:hypothetical protein BEH93_05325 [Streptomyces sp. 2R]GFN09842.1 hypothetical protein Smic_83980 [Streptomyces microflavus]GGX94254.1 hypothetical protein GCM10010298_69470 [Streptomyces microflavus]
MGRDAHAAERDHCRFAGLIPEVVSYQAMFGLLEQSAIQTHGECRDFNLFALWADREVLHIHRDSLAV